MVDLVEHELSFRNILVVDPSSSGGALERELLESGRQAARAKTIAEALALLQERAPDIAIIELRIGDESGLDLLDAIRASATPTGVVVATMYGTIAAAREVMNRGALGFFAKPVTLSQILAGLTGSTRADGLTPLGGESPWLTVDAMRGRYIQDVLEHYGSLAQAAKVLHVDRRSLRRMMRRLKLRD